MKSSPYLIIGRWTSEISHVYHVSFAGPAPNPDGHGAPCQDTARP